MAVRTACDPRWSEQSNLRADGVFDRLRITGKKICTARHFRRRYLFLWRKSAVGRRASTGIVHLMGRAFVRRYRRWHQRLSIDEEFKAAGSND
jgi:hypothetical protein